MTTSTWRASVVMLAVILTTTAFGYEDTGLDPDDMPNGTSSPDISSTTRKVRQTADGRRFLSVTIRSSEAVMRSGAWVGKVHLDARAGSQTDDRIVFRTFMIDRCGIGRRARFRAGHLRVTDRSATCVLPLRFVDPSKRIRWRARTANYFPEPSSTVDVAPNGGGWYR